MIGHSDGISSQKVMKTGKHFHWCFWVSDCLKVGGRKEEGEECEAAGSDVMSIFSQCYTSLSLNMNYLYLKSKTVMGL